MMKIMKTMKKITTEFAIIINFNIYNLLFKNIIRLFILISFNLFIFTIISVGFFFF